MQKGEVGPTSSIQYLTPGLAANAHRHTTAVSVLCFFLCFSSTAPRQSTNGDPRSADASGNLSVGAGRRGGVRGAAVAGGLDVGVGLVDASAARPGPAGPGPQGHQVPPLHRRPEGNCPG